MGHGVIVLLLLSVVAGSCYAQGSENFDRVVPDGFCVIEVRDPKVINDCFENCGKGGAPKIDLEIAPEQAGDLDPVAFRYLTVWNWSPEGRNNSGRQRGTVALLVNLDQADSIEHALSRGKATVRIPSIVPRTDLDPIVVITDLNQGKLRPTEDPPVIRAVTLMISKNQIVDYQGKLIGRALPGNMVDVEVLNAGSNKITEKILTDKRVLAASVTPPTDQLEQIQIDSLFPVVLEATVEEGEKIRLAKRAGKVFRLVIR